MSLADRGILDSHANRELRKLEKEQKQDFERLFDGMAEICQGELIIHPPRGFGKYPIIKADENVELLINGKKVDIPVVVHDTDEISINTADTLPRIEMNVKISEDKLSALLTVKRIPGKKYALTESGPMPQQKIMAQCIEEVEPESLLYGEIIEELNRQGIIYGIQEEAVLKVMQSRESKMTVVVAKGLPPTESSDATILYNFENENKENVKNPYGDGKIHSVSLGEIVAIKRPPVQGNPGIDVMGQPVSARVPKDFPIWIKDGVKLIKEGSVAVATISGRPVLEGYKKYLSVRPLYVIEGDVDLRIGNIDFNGDVIITGSVLDGFTVKAGGSISVYGNVLHASLYAHGDIIIKKNAITANIRAGGSTVPYKRVHQLLSNLALRIESLFEAIQTIKSQSAFSTLDLKEKGDGQLVQLLLDLKFKDIPKLVQRLVELILNEKNDSFIPEVIRTTSLLNQKLCNLGPMRINQDLEILLLLDEVRKSLDVVERFVDTPANIFISYVQNSSVQASGDVLITGKGSITSRIEAEGKIDITNGVVRGGELAARESIKVLELGSRYDAEVHINLKDNCILEARTVHPVIVIRYGSEVRMLLEPSRNLKATIYHGRFMLEHF